jgi:phospholipid/cholesterol/gamma-HCH transport system permease protein
MSAFSAPIRMGTGQADFELVDEEGGPVLILRGDWTTAGLGRAGARLIAATRSWSPSRLDVSDLGAFDTAGAFSLLEAGVEEAGRASEERPDVAALLALVAGARRAAVPVKTGGPSGLYGALVRLGRGAAHFGAEGYRTLAFYGRLLTALGRLILHPNRFRPAATVSLMERAGLDALPIVATTSFFVGATLAFMGQDLLSQYGGQVFSVELVGISVLREFGVLVTAIILAGRSASSFAAELGAMRMNQEVDAMQVMGVDPFEALVIPRFLALLLMTPLLTFVAMIAGLVGGLLVVWGAVGLSPAFFLQRLLDNVGIGQFYLGVVKAPFLAMIIAAIGCRQGLEVGGDVESLGRRVTTAVVQALFAIIIADAAFAFLFVELGQ